jgi:hypothetical protein
MKKGLTVVMSNPEPQRGSAYPCSWVLYGRNGMITFTIDHDKQNRPYVASKKAA